MEDSPITEDTRKDSLTKTRYSIHFFADASGKILNALPFVSSVRMVSHPLLGERKATLTLTPACRAKFPESAREIILPFSREAAQAYRNPGEWLFRGDMLSRVTPGE